jgi:putative colanic acid biosynthesis acetyltransferase WcaF
MLQVSQAPTVTSKVGRALWNIVRVLMFRFTPAPLHIWRVFILRAFGARIGKGCSIYPDAIIWAPWRLHMEGGACLGPRVTCYNVADIRLAAGAIVSQGAHLCSATHDIHNADFALMIAPITIGPGAWVAAEAFVHPGLRIGACAVVGARSVVTRDVAAGVVVAGNPARTIAERSQVTAR